MGCFLYMVAWADFKGNLVKTSQINEGDPQTEQTHTYIYIYIYV